MKLLPLAPILAACVAAPLPAQIGSTNHVAFLTKSGNGNLMIETKDVANACPKQAVLRCTSALNGAKGGGVAYDARADGFWVTDGSTLELITSSGCQRIASTAIAPNNSRASIVGLTLDLPRRRLWHVESTPGFVGLQAYDVSSFQPQRIANLAPTRTLSGGRVTPVGAEVDPGRGVVFLLTTTPALIGWANELVVLTPDLRVEVCRTAIQECRRPPDPSRAMAFDVGRDEVLVELAGGVRRLRVDNAGRCSLTDLGCCGKGGPLTDIVGLTVVPGAAVERRGKACTPAACACPSMSASTRGGVPAIGNPDLALTLDMGPTGASAFLVINGGPCQPATVPLVCAPVQPALAGALVLPIGSLKGSSTCDGAVELALPLPANPALAGQRICTQWLVACPSAGTLGASEGLEILLGGR